MDSLAATVETIPELFEAAVAEVPGEAWLLHDDATFTYAEARAQIGRAAAALTDRGVGRGDLVLATARNRPEYLFTWLAAMYVGAIYVAVDPARPGRSWRDWWASGGHGRPCSWLSPGPIRTQSPGRAVFTRPR